MFSNRVTGLLGVDIPIVQAPMGWIARAQLAAAVSEAGAMGIIETSSGELDAIRDEIRKMRDLTEKPFGVNIAQAFVRDASIVDFVVGEGIRFVTTSAGSPMRYTAQLKDAGLTVFHVVPTLHAAQKAADAGVDGLIVEGGEGGGFKNPRPVASMVLLPLVVSKIDLPVIAAGGFLDGPTMAAALALGAEGIQLGTRMVSAAESPIHDNWKQAIVAAAETDTVFLNQHAKPALRTLRTERTSALEFDTTRNAMAEMANHADLYFGGDMEAALAMCGQVAGRIDAVRPVAEIIDECARDCLDRLATLAASYPSDRRPSTGASDSGHHPGMADPDKSAQLRAVPIFAALHEDALWSLGESASDFDAAAGQVLIQPNQPGNGLLILTSGQASVELGTQTIECGPGECIGELSLLVDDLVHTARVRAVTDVRGFAISRADFERLIDSDSRIALAMLRAVALRLVATDRLLTTKR